MSEKDQNVPKVENIKEFNETVSKALELHETSLKEKLNNLIEKRNELKEQNDDLDDKIQELRNIIHRISQE